MENRDIADYSQKYLDNEYSFEKYQVHYRRKKVLEQIDLYKHDHIVEIGCGMEPLFEYFHDFDSMVVVEPSTVFFENAAEKAKAYKNVSLINEFFENAHIDTNQADLILISSLLHEVPDAEKFLNSVRQKCKYETVVHINVPNACSFHRLLAYKSGLIAAPEEFSSMQIKLQQNRIFDLGSLANLVSSADFEVIDSGSYFIKPFTHLQMKALLDTKIIDEKILEGFYDMVEYLPELGSEIFVDIRLKR